MKQGMTRDALMYNFNEINKLCCHNSKILLCGRPTLFESEEEQAAVLSGGDALESDSNRLCNATSLILLEKAPARIDHAADRLRDISLTLAM